MVAVGGILAPTIDGPQGCLMMMVIKCVFFFMSSQHTPILLRSVSADQTLPRFLIRCSAK